MKIVILDGYTENPGDLSWDGFKEFGELTVYDRCPEDEDEIIRRIGDAEVAYINKVALSRKVFEKCPGLKFVGVLATGYNVVDIVAAKEFGVPVANIPTYGTDAVGQFAIGMLLEICHHIGHHSDAVHSGRWSECIDFCFWDYPLIELAGKTMGIIGFGRIGQVTGRIAKALGMKVIACDSFPTDSGREIAEYTDLETVIRSSDVISLHCPLFPETKGIICKENIEKMKDGVIILNNSRGPLIVEQDLADALNSGKVYAAGLDVLCEEPANKNNPLFAAKNCIITPHISWASKESRQRLMNIAVDNLRQFIAGNPVNIVNK